MPIGARHHHTVTTLSPTSFLIFGGKSQRYLNDLWRVELVTSPSSHQSVSHESFTHQLSSHESFTHQLSSHQSFTHQLSSSTQSSTSRTDDRLVLRWTEIVATPRSSTTAATDCDEPGCATNNACQCGQGGRCNRYSGQAPSRRYGHSAVIYNQCLWVFGGYDAEGLTCNDLHMFDMRLAAWQRIDGVGLLPPGVYHHTAVVFQGSMYVFGGCTATAVYEYRFGTQTWSTTIARGYTPRPRFGHAASVWREWMFIFGGHDPTSDDHGEMYRYSFRDGFWSRVDSPSLAGTSRSFACAARTESRWYLHGGRHGGEADDRLFDDLLEYTFDPDEDDQQQHRQRRRPDDAAACTLQADLLWLLSSGLFYDICFVCTGASHLPHPPPPADTARHQHQLVYLRAHRNVVFARCPALAAMFPQAMHRHASAAALLPTLDDDNSTCHRVSPAAEQAIFIAELDFVDTHTFSTLLRFFYAGVLPFDAPPPVSDQRHFATLVDLLRAAHRLALADLHEYCQVKLVDTLNEARLPCLYALAQETNATRIADVCRLFTLQNIRVLAEETKRTLPKELLKQLAKQHATGRIFDLPPSFL